MSLPRIYLDLPDELRQLIDRSGLSVTDIVRAEETDLDVTIRPAELPAADDDERSRGIGFEIVMTPEMVISIGVAAALVIRALSKFFRDRRADPRVVTKFVERRITGDDGKLKRVLVPEEQFIEPAAATAVEIEAKLGLKDGAMVRIEIGESALD